MSLLERIKELREANGNISINRLEKEAGLTRGSMSKWDDHIPSYDKLKKVADYFNVPVSNLTGEQKENTAPISEDGKAEILSIFDSLSLDRRSKLIELARLYLADQRKSEEMK